MSFIHRSCNPINVLLSTVRRKVNLTPWWPTLQNPWVESASANELTLKPSQPRIRYEASKSDFKWVSRLLSTGFIPKLDPNLPNPSPSGWVPPNPELSKTCAYFVRRTKNHMLPIYFVKKQRKSAERAHGTRSLTLIRYIDGDMWALADDLRDLLQPKCDGEQFLCQVDEPTRQIRIEGIFVEEVSNFLLEKGF